MKFLDEYRDRAAVRAAADALARVTTRPWVLMEVCGGQTHSIVKYGLDALLPECLELVHGPGCPVCVTPLTMIDRAHAIAARPNVTFCSFGDMLRVPGSTTDLLSLKSKGADVRVVYSPLDAVRIAEENPDRDVVFFAIGFETTAPANAMAVKVARARNLGRFSVLVSHVLVPPMLVAMLEAEDNRVQGFLGPGHVCTVMGTREYEPVTQRFGVPIVVSGFEPLDLMDGIRRVVTQLEQGRSEVENGYARAVAVDGNPHGRRVMDEVFEVSDQAWRGIGTIEGSGLRLRDAYRSMDAAARFEVEDVERAEPKECISGAVLRGQAKPVDCSAFGKRCTPEHPLGATMVSAEGACAAYFAYRRDDDLVSIRPSRS